MAKVRRRYREPQVQQSVVPETTVHKQKEMQEELHNQTTVDVVEESPIVEAQQALDIVEESPVEIAPTQNVIEEHAAKIDEVPVTQQHQFYVGFVGKQLVTTAYKDETSQYKLTVETDDLLQVLFFVEQINWKFITTLQLAQQFMPGYVNSLVSNPVTLTIEAA